MSYKQYSIDNYSDNWSTPKELYDYFLSKGFIDPCPLTNDFVDCIRFNYFNKRLFINPPFSKINVFTDWVLRQVFNDNAIFYLIPCRTDTKYFQKLLCYGPTIIFIGGRLNFNDSKKSAPFPSCLIIFDGSNRYLHVHKKNLIEFLDNIFFKDL